MSRSLKRFYPLILLIPLLFSPVPLSAREGKPILDQRAIAVIDSLIQRYGESERDRIERGVSAVLERWREEDEKRGTFSDFCMEHFVPRGEMLDRLFNRMEHNLEVLFGNLHIISREFSSPLHLDIGEPIPIDYIFAEYDPYAHIEEDFYNNRLAFILLLNFPPYSLEETLKYGEGWSRREWAYAKLAEPFKHRVPAEVRQKVSEAFTKVDNYISEYNIYMGSVVDRDMTPLFDPDLRLICHWGLRDELKAQYSNKDGRRRQEVIYKIMERVIDGTIPQEVINRNDFLWEPFGNDLFDKKTKRPILNKSEENSRRYENLLKIFKAQRLIDPYIPDAPTLIDRRFKINRQMLEEEVEALLTSILKSPLTRKVGRLIQKRLKRKLRPYDIWWTGFKPRHSFKEEELDRIVRNRYPDIGAFERDIPSILEKLGFDRKTAIFLAEHIAVDPSRGAGHAMGAEMRKDKAHLRTRVPKEGMNYKGFNIAMHELGHCVEQVFTLNRIDYYSLRGVPNTAFTESFAFMFQSRDLEILGLVNKGGSNEALDTLNTFWATNEISGVALVDMMVWRWLYNNPDAKPHELKEAVIDIAKKVWNDYFAPIFGVRDIPILAIYSHMIDSCLYLPDYPLGHIIHFMKEEYIRGKSLGKEMERMCSAGSITPDLWMKKAVGTPVSTEPFLKAVKKALKEVD